MDLLLEISLIFLGIVPFVNHSSLPLLFVNMCMCVCACLSLCRCLCFFYLAPSLSLSLSLSLSITLAVSACIQDPPLSARLRRMQTMPFQEMQSELEVDASNLKRTNTMLPENLNTEVQIRNAFCCWWCNIWSGASTACAFVFHACMHRHIIRNTSPL